MRRTKIFYGWYVTAACFGLCFLFAGGGFYSFSIFINPIESEFGWPRADISLAMSIYLICAGLMGPLVGRLIEKFGTKIIMNLGALGAGICFLLISRTQSIGYFYVSYALLAVSISGFGVIPVGNTLANWFEKRRGTAVGIAMMGISAGGLLLAPFVRYFNSFYGWKASFASIGILIWVVALPLINFIIKEKPEDIGASVDGLVVKTGNKEPSTVVSKQNQLEGWPAKKALKNGKFWCLFLSFFLTPFAQMGVLQHQVPMVMGAGVSETMAAYALGATAGIGALGKLSFGRISETLPFRFVVAVCFGMQAMAVVVLLMAHSAIMVWSYSIVFGFAMGGVVVLLPLAVGHFWGVRSYGILLGVVWIANCIGGALGTYTSGLIYDYLGDYRFALYLYFVSYLVSITAFLLAGKPKVYLPDLVPT